MAPLVWQELSDTEKEILNDQFDDQNANMKDMIRYPNQRMAIPRSYLKVQDDMKNFPLKEDDIWIVTYPKCGTTWMQETVTMLIHDMDKEYGKLPQVVRSPFLELDTLMGNMERRGMAALFKDMPPKVEESMKLLKDGQLAYAKIMPGRRILKSHMSFDFLPDELPEKCKVIYVARNPKDCAVSYFHHLSNMPNHGFAQSFSSYVDSFMKGTVLYGDFWAHLESGWKLKDHPNVKLIWFEEMKKDSKKVIEELTQFLGHPLSKEKIDELVNHVSFDVMKKNTSANPTALLKMGKGKDFMRKGKVGDWKNHFTGEQLEAIDAWIQENLDRTGIVLPEQ